MIEQSRIPVLGSVATSTIGCLISFTAYELTVVNVFVTALAVHGYLIESQSKSPVCALGGVALGAGDSLMFSDQGKVGTVMVELRFLPTIHCMATLTATGRNEFVHCPLMGVLMAVFAVGGLEIEYVVVGVSFADAVALAARDCPVRAEQRIVRLVMLG